MKPWQKKEKRDAEFFGAKQTPRSGGLWNKGDMKTVELSIDSKHTTHPSFSISQKLWKKICDDAWSHKPIRIPVLSVEISSGEEFVVVSKADFYDLTNIDVDQVIANTVEEKA